MAITVRFPNGQALQYNDLNNATLTQNGQVHLGKTSDPGHWYVSVPAECVVEFITPCRVYNGITDHESQFVREALQLHRQIRLLRQQVRQMEKARAKKRR